MKKIDPAALHRYRSGPCSELRPPRRVPYGKRRDAGYDFPGNGRHHGLHRTGTLPGHYANRRRSQGFDVDFDSTSLLSRINRGETDSLDEHIIYNLRLAERFSRLSEGHYDVTVKPLVDAWGFAGHEAERTPNLDSLLQFVGYRRVHIRDGRLVKDDPRVQLDFNSIAKGYTVDLVAALMERCGAKNYLVEIGGECRCQGVSSKGIPWRIGIETPFDGNMSDGAYLTGRIRMSEGGLATSGNYRRFYRDAAGNKISHTIDPTTGRSVTSRLLSATVVADNCAEADAWRPCI